MSLLPVSSLWVALRPAITERGLPRCSEELQDLCLDSHPKAHTQALGSCSFRPEWYFFHGITQDLLS